MNEHMVAIPNYLQERIDKRLAELVELHPDVDRDWLANEMLMQALTNDVPPESISLQKTEPK
jgi:hypothetical protein